jgi:uncharacterized protein (DUF433 family)
MGHLQPDDADRTSPGSEPHLARRNARTPRTARVACWTNAIGIDAGVLGGKPVIRGTRLAVEFVVGLLAQGWTFEQILDNYPGITREQILARLAYAADSLRGEHVFPRAS